VDLPTSNASNTRLATRRKLRNLLAERSARERVEREREERRRARLRRLSLGLLGR
jgi:hypothetical protein